ncbi:MAG: C25 family peptidase propeptide domain-containing protein, partial [Planctomycetota bacterium]
MTTTPGLPMLPQTAVLFFARPGARVSVTVLENRFEEVDAVRVLPAPDVDVQAGQPLYQYQEDPTVYTQPGFWPDGPLGRNETGILRAQQVVRLPVYPLQYAPQAQKLRICRQLSFEVIFSGGTALQTAAGTPLDRVFFSKLADGLFANSPLPLPPKSLTKPASAGWYQPSFTYTKLQVDADGIYALSYDDLSSAGVPVNTLDRTTLKLYFKGSEIPILITGPQTDA